MDILHAPWRIQYILAPKPPPGDTSLFARIAQSNDDVANSQIPMHLRLTGQGVWAYWGDQTDFWREVHGRFFPLSGLETILVLTGVTTREQAERYPYRPTHILDSVADIELPE